jgi:hypothetical protein
MSYFTKVVYRIQWLKKHLFEILVILSIIFILLIGIYRIIFGYNGTWADHYYYVSPKTEDLDQKLTEKYRREKQNSEPSSWKNGKDSNGEIRTRRYLENRFKKPFSKTRPDFLLNQVTGSKYNLEFDCYNEELKLAVEYNGIQHYKFVPFFHRNKEAFYNQKYRDELKRIKCRDLGITLVEIPYSEEKRLEEYLAEQLRTIGY